jgi:hypothetical protein
VLCLDKGQELFDNIGNEMWPIIRTELKGCAETTKVFQKALSSRQCRSIYGVIKLNPPCEGIDDNKDILPVWKRSYEVYV